MEVAEIIAQQLGGARFRAMTGARNLVAIDSGLQFQLPARFAKNKATHVQIRLNGNDLYDVRFFSLRALQIIERGSLCDVCAEMLAREFTEATGLDTFI